MSDTIRLIIDTDPGQDDAAAILMAHGLAKRGLIDFMALTAVAGNVGIKLTERLGKSKRVPGVCRGGTPSAA